MNVVDPEVTKLKLDREIELWHENAELYRRRGWILLARRDNEVDVAFLARLTLGMQQVPLVVACVRFDFSNYDVWPPALEFIDPYTGEYTAPVVPAVIETEHGPRNLLIGNHPDTGRPFFCVPGVRQYHTHPQHSGDSWLLHRAGREGALATLCDRIWQAMVVNFVGLQLTLTTLPPAAGQPAELRLQLVSGNVQVLEQAAGEAA
jgi:hypothetical protein